MIKNYLILQRKCICSASVFYNYTQKPELFTSVPLLFMEIKF